MTAAALFRERTIDHRARHCGTASRIVAGSRVVYALVVTILASELSSSRPSPLFAGESALPASVVGGIELAPEADGPSLVNAVISPTASLTIAMGGFFEIFPGECETQFRGIGIAEFALTDLPPTFASASIAFRVSGNGATAPATLQLRQLEGPADLAVTADDANAPATIADELVFAQQFAYSSGDAFRFDVQSELQSAADAGLASVAYRVEILGANASTDIRFDGQLDRVTLDFTDTATGRSATRSARAVGAIELVPAGGSLPQGTVVSSPTDSFDIRRGGVVSGLPGDCEGIISRGIGVMEFDLAAMPRGLESATLSLRVNSNGGTAASTLRLLQLDAAADLVVTEGDALRTATLAAELVFASTFNYSNGDVFTFDVRDALQSALDAGFPAVSYRLEIRAEFASTNIRFRGNPAAVLLEFAANGGRQVPGDCNQDGALDVSDGICVLGLLFGGGTQSPCGEGALNDAANVLLLDANGDARLDLSDAVRLFGYLFLGGLPPVLGTECVVIDACSTSVCGA